MTNDPKAPESVSHTEGEAIREAIYLLGRNQLPCPFWKEGVGDCNQPGCEPCRVYQCIEALEGLVCASEHKSSDGDTAAPSVAIAQVEGANQNVGTTTTVTHGDGDRVTFVPVSTFDLTKPRESPDGPTASRPACLWRDNQEFWSTSCGQDFTFLADGPKENGFNYCHHCGKPIELDVEPQAGESDDD